MYLKQNHWTDHWISDNLLGCQLNEIIEWFYIAQWIYFKCYYEHIHSFSTHTFCWTPHSQNIVWTDTLYIITEVYPTSFTPHPQASRHCIVMVSLTFFFLVINSSDGCLSLYISHNVLIQILFILSVVAFSSEHHIVRTLWEYPM